MPKRTVANVFVGCSLLGAGSQDAYTAIRNELWALRMRSHRSYALPENRVLTEETRELIANADLLIFDLTHGSPSVVCELVFAMEYGHGPERMLFVARHGAPPPAEAMPGELLLYTSLDDLRAVVRRWQTRPGDGM